MIINEQTQNVQITFTHAEVQMLLQTFTNLEATFILEDIELSLGNPDNYMTAFFVKSLT